MDERFLIRNTTKEQREEIIKRSLGQCGNCDGCGIAGMADIYQDYIDGNKELADITKEFNLRYTRG